MTVKKSTKRTLLTSGAILILCFTMLVGTTFAWLTDTAKSSGNRIITGSIKVDLELLQGGSNSWTSVKESQDAIYDYDKWEPGYTDVKILRVSNKGTLALKWKAKISTNGLSSLANVIDVYIAKNINSYPTDKNALNEWMQVGNLASFAANMDTYINGELEAGRTETFAIALKMQSNVGNEYLDMSLGEFDVNIIATQLASESDSFDDQYDKDAR